MATSPPNPVCERMQVKEYFGTMQHIVFASSVDVCSYIGRRNSICIGNQLYFMRFYKNYMKALGLPRGKYVSVDFICWLLGLPPKFFDLEVKVDSQPGHVLPFIRFGPVAPDGSYKLPTASLCSGIGGLEGGLSDVFDVRLLAESNEYARKVLVDSCMGVRLKTSCPLPVLLQNLQLDTSI